MLSYDVWPQKNYRGNKKIRSITGRPVSENREEYAVEKKRIGHIFITMWRKWRRWRFVCVISIVFVRLVSPQTVHLNKKEDLNKLKPDKSRYVLTGNPSQATFQSSWTALLLEVFNLRLPSKNFSQWFKWGTLHPIKQP